MNIPIKHHYIPQFYLKGFADENEDIYILDKTFKKISSHKKAGQLFYKKNLHTLAKDSLIINGLSEKDRVIIENFMGRIEKAFSLFIDFISNNFETLLLVQNLNEMPEEMNKILLFMMSVQYWRHPKSSRECEKHAENLVKLYDQALAHGNDFLDFFDDFDRKSIKYFQKKRHKESSMKVIQFVIIPIISYQLMRMQIGDLRVVKLNSDDEFVCPDFPVIFDSFDDNFNASGSIFYPLSKQLAITNIDFNQISEIDRIIYEKADNKIIGSSPERLQELLNLVDG